MMRFFPPTTYYYRDILKKYPDAKFIIEDLDGTEVYKRYQRIKRLISWMNWVKLFQRTREFKRFVDIDLSLGYANKKTSIDIQVLHRNLINEYERHIPQRQLYTFSAKDGWEPLCKFLGKPVPSEKMPMKGKVSTLEKNNFSILLSSVNKNLIFILIYISVLVGLFMYLLFYY